MQRRGGFLDIDQLVEVEDGDLKVVESGEGTAPRMLDKTTAGKVDDLAWAVLALPSTAMGNPNPLSSDDMQTVIEIDDGGRSRRFIIRSGADAPPQLSALITALDDLARA